MTFDSVYLWMMVFVRAGGLLVLVPVFSGQNIPVQLRVAVAALLAAAVTAFVPAAASFPPDVITLIFIAARELMIGLIMGAAARLIFYAIECAGQIISTEMGLMMSSQVDPISRNPSSPVGIALFYGGALLFLFSGCHHVVFAAFLRSFAIAPIGQLGFTRHVAELFVISTGKIFLIAVQMAAPLMAVNFVVTFTFAVLGKAAPSINVFSESFSVRILAGIAIFGVALGLTAQLVLSCMRQSPELMLQLIP
ncbi:MAG: flagellar biosynthetic protein FliR [Chthoniobacteraceae bacterium]|nr:flagellar biosynthetic protein FliR [Chthoniobacteraceae bacterium]